MGELNLESMLAMREVLTLEQRKRFAQLMQHRKGKYRNPIENRRGQQF
jgi:Spy/CpxP family protein refolding chaperone